MIDYEWYQSFVAVYRAGTVTAGAEARFLTQPAVTQHLAALEAAVGEPLFQRTPRRMLPTERGKELYSQIIQSLEKLEQVTQTLRGEVAASQAALIRLGSPLEYYNEVGLARLAKAALRFWIRFGVARDLIEDLERGELDAVIATQRVATRVVEFERLDEERFLLVAAPHLKIPIFEGLTIADEPTGKYSPEYMRKLESWLAAQPWISYGVEMPIIRRFWQRNFRGRPEFKPALVIPDLHTIAKAIELGYGISLLPDYLCRPALESGRLRLLWELPHPITNELWLAYRRADRNRLEIKQVQALLLERVYEGE